MRGVGLLSVIGFGWLVLAPATLAQGQEVCKTEKELLTTMMIGGARDVVRRSMEIFKCGDVRAEAQRWLDAIERQGTGTPATGPSPSTFPQPPPAAAVPSPAPAPAARATAGDTMATARPVALTPGDTQLDDRIAGHEGAKFYRIEIDQLSIITAYLTGPTSGIRFVLLNATGTELVGLAKPDAANVYKLESARAAGVYFLAVMNPGKQTTHFQVNINLVSPAPQHSHPDIAHKLRLDAGFGGYDTAFGGDGSYRYAEFEITRAGLYKIALRYAGGDTATDIDLRLLRYKGVWEKIADSQNGPGEEELVVEWLPVGRYQIELYRDAGDKAQVVASMAPTSEALTPSFSGQEVTREIDWQVLETMVDGNKRCYAYTLAKSFTPSAWRGHHPYLLVRIDEGDDSVFHTFDKRRFYRDERPFTAIISGNVNFQIPVMFEGDQDDLKTLEVCRQDATKFCVSDEGLVGLTLGREIEITGTTTDGRPSLIVYSLRGYQKAVQAMNQACRNERNTGWLLKRR